MSLTKNLKFEKTSFLSKTNSAFIEQMYLKYANKDKDLPQSWKEYFDDLGDELNLVVDEIKGPSWSRNRSEQELKNIEKVNEKEKIEENQTQLQIKKDQKTFSSDQTQSNIDSIRAVELIRAYRLRGHLLEKLDPLGLKQTEYLEELHPEFNGFEKSDYKRNIFLNDVNNKKNYNISEILK